MSALLAPNDAATAALARRELAVAPTGRTPRFAIPVPPARPAHSAAPAPSGSRAYRLAVRAFDTTHRMRPALAGVATSVADVQDALAVARRDDLGVRMHSTGHGASAQADMSGELLLRVQIDEPVTYDEASGLVRIPAGAAWGSVVPVLAPHGRTAAHGSSGHVGAVGYLSKGGLSAYARSTGVAANSVEAIELVLADGRPVTVDATHEPELFWALRGGGGGFGVITAMHVRTFAPGALVTGAAFWRLDDAPAVADAWDEWTRTAPANVTTSMRCLTVMPVPGMPLRLAGRRFLVVSGTAVDAGPGIVPGQSVGALDAAAGLIGRLKAVAAPVFDSWQPADVLEVPNTHMDPPVGAPHDSDHMLLDDVADAGPTGTTGASARSAVGTWLELAAHGVARPAAFVELRQLGGALATAPADGGAVASLPGRFGYFAGSPRLPWQGAAANKAMLDEVRSALSGWDTGRTAPTFAADRERPQRSFGAETAARAAAVRRAVDPAGMFASDTALGALVVRGVDDEARRATA
jgi:FAD/FMN-containing dehydrogenase